MLPADVPREYVYVGATVQDLTDTWFALVMRDVGALVWRDLRAVEELLLDLAVRAPRHARWSGARTASPARRSRSA